MDLNPTCQNAQRSLLLLELVSNSLKLRDSFICRQVAWDTCFCDVSVKIVIIYILY